jgi:tRNA A37 threonylcarbamoyladenosine dehydratase
MNLRRRYSRPLRFAAEIGGLSEERLADYFPKAQVAIRLEPTFKGNRDARETFCLALNMVLRFCSGVTVILPAGEHELAALSRELANAILGTPNGLRAIGRDPSWHGFDAVLNIGRDRRDDLAWITVNSTGWLARIALSGAGKLYWARGAYNPIGALAAACLGVGQVFMVLVQRSRMPAPIEISLFTHEAAQPGVLDPGPVLPENPLSLDGLLIGCGGVSNGWGYAIRRLPIVGSLQAVDRQAVREENLGPYVGAFLGHLAVPKTKVIRHLLGPKIEVTTRSEEFELFKIRLNLGLLPLAPLVIAGVDNVATRHSLQRLWPRMLIDMASGGATSQTIVKLAALEGICMLGAHAGPADEPDYADQLSAATGLSAERIRNSPIEPISDSDVKAAPEPFRASLEEARRRRQLICGRMTEYNLGEEAYSDQFAPAVPFVTAFSGIVGAAETMRAVMDEARPVHYQFDFRSFKGRALAMRCGDGCDCQVQHQRLGPRQMKLIDEIP